MIYLDVRICLNVHGVIPPLQDSGDSDDEDLAEAYYEAKNKKTSGPEDAVDAFERVLTLELRDAKRTEWGFKALKQLLKLGAAKVCTECGRILTVYGSGRFLRVDGRER